MNYPLDAQVTPRFAGSATFYRLPIQPDADNLDVAVMGIPFDGATSFRTGSRFGPRAIREMSSLLRPFNRVLDIDPYTVLNVADVGDCAINPFNTMESLELIHARMLKLAQHGGIPLSFGGDHLVTLGVLRGLAQVHGPLAVIQVDAHIDTWDTYFGIKYTHGSFMRRSIEEGLVDTAHTIQIGIRGALFSPDDVIENERLGLEILPMDSLIDAPVDRIVSQIRERVGDRRVYITFDIDGVDPAYSPGTGAPEVGGLSSQQTMAILNRLVGLDIVGADVVEVIPAYDPAQITALFAARVGFEILSLMACRRQQSYSARC